MLCHSCDNIVPLTVLVECGQQCRVLAEGTAECKRREGEWVLCSMQGYHRYLKVLDFFTGFQGLESFWKENLNILESVNDESPVVW